MKLLTGNDLLFVSFNVFPNHSINTVGVSILENFTPKNSIDEINLLRFKTQYVTSNLSLKKSDVNRLYYNKMGNPCGIVHHCSNGFPGSVCHPFGNGCYSDPCSYQTFQESLIKENLLDELEYWVDELPEADVYNFRNLLGATQNGGMYVDAFYTLTPFFSETLDLELIYDITSATYEIGSFVSAFLNDNPTYVLDSVVFDTFVSIATKSAQKSENMDYKEIIAGMIENVKIYKNKTISEIKIILDE